MFYFRYVFALTYDIFVLVALFFFFTLICLALKHGQTIAPGTKWFQWSLALIYYFYYYFSYRLGGQTIGMRAWGLQIHSTQSRFMHHQVLGRLLLMFPAFLYALCRFKSPLLLLGGWTKTTMTFSRYT